MKIYSEFFIEELMFVSFRPLNEKKLEKQPFALSAPLR